MKKIILLIIILILFTGCSYIYNLGNFILPDDLEFLNVIESLQTPKEICQYMLANFRIEDHPYTTLTPYELFLNKKGDCNDFSLFSVFVANYHGYETYQILIKVYPWIFGYHMKHMVGVFKEEGGYSISDERYYLGGIGKYEKTFKEIVDFIYSEGWKSYTVYDYDMNIVETGYNN